MRKTTRAASVLAAVLCILLLFCSCDDTAVAALSPTDRFFVNDFADVITPQAEDTIYAMGVQLFDKTGAQVVAVTVPSLDGKDIQSYSLTLAREWGIGSKDKNNGILLLLAVEDREVRIEVGYGLEGAVTDAQSGALLDRYALPSFSSDNFSDGIYQTYRALINEVYLEYGIQPEEGYIPIEQLTYEEDIPPFAMLGVIVFVIAFVLLFRNKPWFPWLFFFGGGGGYRGGGFGSSGGSFRGFSGGGGSFGGGGASRKF